MFFYSEKDLYTYIEKVDMRFETVSKMSESQKALVIDYAINKTKREMKKLQKRYMKSLYHEWGSETISFFLAAINYFETIKHCGDLEFAEKVYYLAFKEVQ